MLKIWYVRDLADVLGYSVRRTNRLVQRLGCAKKIGRRWYVTAEMLRNHYPELGLLLENEEIASSLTDK
jgi:hypothetical protein